MKKSCLVVIPAYNEEKTISSVIDDVRKNIPESDILVVNDFSSDGTEDILSKKSGIYYINNVFNMGYALSVQTGILFARDRGYKYVIQMDADGQHLASEAKKMLVTLKNEKANIVLGSRYLDKSCGYKTPFFRRIGTSFFSVLIKMLCFKTIKDPLTGLQCLDRKTIEYYSRPGVYPKYPDANLIIEMTMKKNKIIEVPVRMKQRESGVSMHGGIIKPVKYMFSQFYVCIITFITFIGWRNK